MNQWLCFLRQRGMLLPLAVFLLVVLAAMGAFAMRLVVLATASSTQDILGAGAYQAALAGNQWAAYKLYQPDSATPVMQSCPATTTLPINGFSVTVSCTSNAYVDNDTQAVTVYEINSVSTLGTVNTPDYIERQVSLTMSRCIQTIAGIGIVECS